MPQTSFSLKIALLLSYNLRAAVYFHLERRDSNKFIKTTTKISDWENKSKLKSI